MADTPNGTQVNRVLVKLRASTPLAAAAANANLRPVFDRPFPSGGLGADSAPQWFIADVPDLAISPRRQATPLDFAHARLADQLGVDEDDLLFAEPDRVHDQASTRILKGSGPVRPSLRMAATVRRSAPCRRASSTDRLSSVLARSYSSSRIQLRPGGRAAARRQNPRGTRALRRTSSRFRPAARSPTARCPHAIPAISAGVGAIPAASSPRIREPPRPRAPRPRTPPPLRPRLAGPPHLRGVLLAAGGPSRGGCRKPVAGAQPKSAPVREPAWRRSPSAGRRGE